MPAEAVMTVLIAEGVDDHRVEAVGRGDKEPLESNDTEIGRAANRRIILKVLRR